MSGAGCPRVTHPFAALPQGGLPLPGFPLDLHVLSTPPAFVLSQDQTLRRDRFSRPEGRFGFLVWKVDRRDRHVPTISRVAVYDRLPFRTRRTASFPADGENALAFGTLFSSQGASDTQQGLIPGKGSHRPLMVGMERGGVNRASERTGLGPGTAVQLRTMLTGCARPEDRSTTAVG